MPDKPLVLVTGLSGYCAASIARRFLDAGYPVRGTVRKQQQAERWREHEPRVECVVVPNITTLGAFKEAMKGVGVLVHTASPFFYGWKDAEKDMLLPALNGTLEALRSAHSSGTVTRVVLTSSFAAMSDYRAGPNPGKTYSEKDWCPLTWEEAVNEKEDQLLVYVASKAFAEKAAWKFVEEEKSKFTLTTICPVYIMGRSLQPLDSPSDLATSPAWLRDFLDRSDLPPAPLPAMIDVSDVALAHFRAVERAEVAAGQRYLLVGAELSSSEIAIVAREAFPERKERFPEPGGEKGWEVEPHFGWDVSKAEKELGMVWTPVTETVRSGLEQIFELEEKAKR
ncbi:hypothetical protein JCM8547_000498 [Rhodosporidiobolus lusitaniae]